MEHQVSQVRISRVLREVTIKCYKEGGGGGGGGSHALSLTQSQLFMAATETLAATVKEWREQSTSFHAYQAVCEATERQAVTVSFQKKRAGILPQHRNTGLRVFARSTGGEGWGLSIKTQFIIQWRMPSLISGGSALMCKEGRWESPTYLQRAAAAGLSPSVETNPRSGCMRSQAELSTHTPPHLQTAEETVH